LVAFLVLLPFLVAPLFPGYQYLLNIQTGTV
jgi:hypothetical protein